MLQEGITGFSQDVYLYDLNRLDDPPLAYRCAKGGERQPSLLTLLGVPARAWREIAQRLYDHSVYLSQNGGAILLPVSGGVGRYALVVKAALSLPALAYLVSCAGQAAVYADAELQSTPPRVSASECGAVEDARFTVAALHMLLRDCEGVQNAADAESCIAQAAELMGVDLLAPEAAEQAPMRAQSFLREMKPSGQALLVSLLTLLSVMRNTAHARSGWLYAVQEEQGYTLQAVLRCAEDADLSALTDLQDALEDHGVPFGAHSGAAPIKPPKQYAYLHRKITDPRKPLCARCGCLDKRCASCSLTRWAVLPYTCDAALLGVKARPQFVSEPVSIE